MYTKIAQIIPPQLHSCLNLLNGPLNDIENYINIFYSPEKYLLQCSGVPYAKIISLLMLGII